MIGCTLLEQCVKGLSASTNNPGLVRYYEQNRKQVEKAVAAAIGPRTKASREARKLAVSVGSALNKAIEIAQMQVEMQQQQQQRMQKGGR